MFELHEDDPDEPTQCDDKILKLSGGHTPFLFMVHVAVQQSITGQTQTDSHSHSPRGNLGSPVNLTYMFLESMGGSRSTQTHTYSEEIVYIDRFRKNIHQNLTFPTWKWMMSNSEMIPVICLVWESLHAGVWVSWDLNFEGCRSSLFWGKGRWTEQLNVCHCNVKHSGMLLDVKLNRSYYKHSGLIQIQHISWHYE